MKERIRQLMEDLGLTQQDFAKIIGKSTATVSGIFNDRTKPSLDIIDAIHKKFPRVRLEWLIDGTLPMYASAEENTSSETMQGVAQTRGGNYPEHDGSEPYVQSPTLGEASINFDVDGVSSSSASQTPFGSPMMQSVNGTPKNIAQTEVKYIDKPQRKITEIRVFYDDQTWETFVPKK